jgi:uncharacterized protein
MRVDRAEDLDAGRDQPPSRSHRARRSLAALEVAAAASVATFDLLVPTAVLLVMAGLSLRLRREHLTSLGVLPTHDRSLPAKMLGFAAVWSLLHLGLFMPIANHVTGEEQDVSDFAAIEGDLGLLVGWLVLSWTLAAVGEELVYRGYVLTRSSELVGAGIRAVPVAIVGSAAIFGLAHSEQGQVGVILATIDGLAFGVLRHRFGTVWAAVLAHGFVNTIGFVTFFLVGPVHGLW